MLVTVHLFTGPEHVRQIGSGNMPMEPTGCNAEQLYAPYKWEWEWQNISNVWFAGLSGRRTYSAGTSRRAASLRSIVLIKDSTSAGFTK